MPQHVVIDGSNLATEGRTMPSLQQLNEAVAAFHDEYPGALLTVVVDATFGHRIDPKEVAAFDAAVAANTLVTPPAGAIGRGDAFVLSIAHKVSATVLSNDSYQEFHGQYGWLFDEGRLIGGKPVPHVGWVFVTRTPVRGPLSRKSIGDAKRKGRGAKGASASDSSDGSVRIGSPDANKPMPVPSAPPPSVKQAKPPKAAPDSAADAVAASAARPGNVNDLLPFLTFVERHPVGTSVSAVVDHYSSHGAYVVIGDVHAYVPLRLMADPAPRSAREIMKIGETVTLVVESFLPAKRSIDLATPHMASAKPPAGKEPKARREKSTPLASAAPGPPSEPSANTSVVKRAAQQSTKPTKSPATKPAPAPTSAPRSATTKPAATKRAATKRAATKAAATKPAPARSAAPKAAAAKAAPTGRAEKPATEQKKPADRPAQPRKAKKATPQQTPAAKRAPAAKAVK
jgi:hypothetical protein